MTLAMPTRAVILNEALERVNEELKSESNIKAVTQLQQKKELIGQMLNELPHHLHGDVPKYQMFGSDRQCYYQEYLVSINGWSSDVTHTDSPRSYVSRINFTIENSSNLWDSYNTSIRLSLKPAMDLADDWIESGKYDTERHERYDLGLDTALRITVDTSMETVVAMEWAEPYHDSNFRYIAVPRSILTKYKWPLKLQSTNLAEHSIPPNSLLFYSKVNYPDGRKIVVRLQSGEDDCWLTAHLLDRRGKKLTSKCYLYFPCIFQLQFENEWYQACFRELPGSYKAL